jgi:hypothetical protein
MLSHQQIKHIGLTLVELRINLENSESVGDDSKQQVSTETKRSSKRQRLASVTSDTGSDSKSTARTARSTRSSKAQAAAAAASSTMDVDAAVDSTNDTDVSLGDDETDTDAIDTPVTATTPKKSKRVSGYLHVTDAAASDAAVVAGTQAANDAITALGDADSVDSHVLPPWHPFAKVNECSCN